MKRGFIKFHHRARDSQVWSLGLEFRGLLITLIESANFKDSYFLGEKVGRGQLAFSALKFANELNISRNKLLKMLKVFEKNEVIKIENCNNRFTKISILNYSLYQDKNTDEKTTDDTTLDTTDDTTLDTTVGTHLKILRDKDTNNYIAPNEKSSCAKKNIITPDEAREINENNTPPQGYSIYCLPIKSTATEPKVALLKQDNINSWFDSHGKENVLKQLRLAYSWCLSNPARQKTETGISKFFNAWLVKASNSNQMTSTNSDCPYQEFISVYHKELPMLLTVEAITQSRTVKMDTCWEYIKTRITEKKGQPPTQEQSLEWLSKLFKKVISDDWYMGRNGKFKADFDILTKIDTFTRFVGVVRE